MFLTKRETEFSKQLSVDITDIKQQVMVKDIHTLQIFIEAKIEYLEDVRSANSPMTSSMKPVSSTNSSSNKNLNNLEEKFHEQINLNEENADEFNEKSKILIPDNVDKIKQIVYDDELNAEKNGVTSRIVNDELPSVYILKSKNITFNLSTEEYFYEHKNVDKPILLLYQNDKNVVIGKHQNPWKECDITKINEENVNLARRRSGGGAVYQDLGNLCFSFLLPHGPQVDYKKINTEIIINSLKSLGVEAYFNGRNDILVEDRKISGSAYRINNGNQKFKAKTLHHGTILLNVDLDSMMRYLNPNKLKLISKGVDSVKSRVMNINEKFPHLNKDILYDTIEKEFLKYHGVNYQDKNSYNKIFIEDENNNTLESKINELYNYNNSWEWKFGKCPEFTNSLSYKFDWGLIDLSIKCEKGMIQEACVFSDCLDTEFIDNLNNSFKLCKGKFIYNSNGIKELLDYQSQNMMNDNFRKYINDMKNVLIVQV